MPVFMSIFPPHKLPRYPQNHCLPPTEHQGSYPCSAELNSCRQESAAVTETKDIEIVKFDGSIEEYMAREVILHVPDAQCFLRRI